MLCNREYPCRLCKRLGIPCQIPPSVKMGRPTRTEQQTRAVRMTEKAAAAAAAAALRAAQKAKRAKDEQQASEPAPRLTYEQMNAKVAMGLWGDSSLWGGSAPAASAGSSPPAPCFAKDLPAVVPSAVVTVVEMEVAETSCKVPPPPAPCKVPSPPTSPPASVPHVASKSDSDILLDINSKSDRKSDRKSDSKSGVEIVDLIACSVAAVSTLIYHWHWQRQIGGGSSSPLDIAPSNSSYVWWSSPAVERAGGTTPGDTALEEPLEAASWGWGLMEGMEGVSWGPVVGCLMPLNYLLFSSGESLSPSLTFAHLRSPSLTFANLRSPSLAFARLQRSCLRPPSAGRAPSPSASSPSLRASRGARG